MAGCASTFGREGLGHAELAQSNIGDMPGRTEDICEYDKLVQALSRVFNMQSA